MPRTRTSDYGATSPSSDKSMKLVPSALSTATAATAEIGKKSSAITVLKLPTSRTAKATQHAHHTEARVLVTAIHKGLEGPLKISSDEKYLIWVPQAPPRLAIYLSLVLCIADLESVTTTQDYTITVKTHDTRGGSTFVFKFKESTVSTLSTVAGILTRALLFAKSATGSGCPPSASLLTLPVELRNIIFKKALLEKYSITVVPQLRPPALLATCRVIRGEAKPIWYSQKFTTPIWNCDASLLVKWLRHLTDVGRRRHPRTYGQVLGHPNWSNLEQWCRAVHEKKTNSYPRVPGRTSLGETVRVTLRIAEQCRKLSWAECAQLLMTYREAIGLIDKKWLED